MKRTWLLIPIFLLGLSLLSIGCGGATPRILKIDGNLAAANVEAGMVYEEDFVLDYGYFDAFATTVICSDIHIEGDSIYYRPVEDLAGISHINS